MSHDVVSVGIAEAAVVQRGRLRTAGLGSCVGVVIFDAWARIAGLAHVMLPAAPGPGSGSPAKYAATAVPWLVQQICQMGGCTGRLQAKLAGGAQMFASTGMSDFMRVGPRNVEAVLAALAAVGIPVASQDVGGQVGRTIEFDVQTERLWVRTARGQTYCI